MRQSTKYKANSLRSITYYMLVAGGGLLASWWGGSSPIESERPLPPVIAASQILIAPSRPFKDDLAASTPVARATASIERKLTVPVPTLLRSTAASEQKTSKPPRAVSRQASFTSCLPACESRDPLVHKNRVMALPADLEPELVELSSDDPPEVIHPRSEPIHILLYRVAGVAEYVMGPPRDTVFDVAHPFR